MINSIEKMLFQLKYDQRNLQNLRAFFKTSKVKPSQKHVKIKQIYSHDLVKDGPKELADFFVKNLAAFEDSFSMLNIGIGLDVPPAWLKFFKDVLGYKKIASIEAWEPYIKKWQYGKIFPVWYGDVRDLVKLLPPKSVDTILWAHGPEHVGLNEFPAIYHQLKRVAKQQILMVTPWGGAYDYQEDINNNPYEIHHVKAPDERIYADTFIKQVTWGKKGTLQAGLLAYEFIEDENKINWHEDFIIELAKVLRPKTYVELGLFESALFNRMIPYADKLIGVDCETKMRKFMTKSAKTTFYGLKTDDYLKILKKNPYKIDLLFIDANHSEKSVLRDFKNYFPYVADQGIILLHDGYPKDEKQIAPGYCGDGYKAIEKISKKNLNYEIVTLPIVPGLSICRKRKNHLNWSS